MLDEYTCPDDPSTAPSVAPATLAPVTQIRPTTIGYVYYTEANGFYGPANVVLTSADLDVNGWVTPILGATSRSTCTTGRPRSWRSPPGTPR